MNDVLARIFKETAMWRANARCSNGNVQQALDDREVGDVWFPTKGSDAMSQAKLAKALCNGDGEDVPPCPVKDACREYALDTNQKFGIWGGLSEQERTKIRRNRRRMRQERGRRLVRTY